LKLVWKKPVITFYKERFGNPEREPFVAVKARSLSVSTNENDFTCILEDFFPIMGELDYISTNEGKTDNYVLCWFDDEVNDFSEAFRRLTGVTFPKEIRCVTNQKGKKICNVTFKAKHGKLE
jgi:hypothetical protein